MKPILDILLIDDDEEDFIITRHLIEDTPHHKYKIDWVESYENALEIFDKNKYAVYLLDYKLGNHVGLDIIKEARRKNITAPFILLTGLGNSELDEEAMKAGASDYLIKGNITATELDRSIRYSLEHANNLTQIKELNLDLEKRVTLRTKELEGVVRALELTNRTLENQIIENKKTEAQLLNRELLLHEAHRIGRSAAFVWDITNDAIEFSREFYTIAERSKDEFEHTFQGIQKIIHGDDVRKFKAIKNAFVRKASPYHTELRFVLPSKKIKFVYSEWNIENDANGLPARLIGFTQDITERKIAESQIRIALQKANELNELKSRFISMTSHEFRTPLTTILSSVELIVKYFKKQETEKFEKHVKKIKGSVSNLTELLDYFLSVEKLEEGRVELENSEFDIVKLFHEQINEMSDSTKTGQHLLFSSNIPLCIVKMDKKICRTILQNLLSNAIKYSGENTSVDVQFKKTDKHILLSVSDQGIGIPENEQQHLFERFYRAKNATNIQGTGLGLNIIKKYIELMNGRITFISEQHIGSKFIVEIPLITP
jgi:signal transduction histidine kinase/DNA-binding response OmpR family regulator